MRWDLLFSDVLARVVGLIGIMAAVPFFADAVSNGDFTSKNMSLEASLGLGGSILAVSLLFLLPKPHEVALRVSRPWLIRPGFFGLTVLWAILVCLGLTEFLTQVRAQNPGSQLAQVVWFSLPTFLLIFTLLVFPFGYGWRPYREIHAEYEKQRAHQRAQQIANAVVPGTNRLTNGTVLRKQDVWDHLMSVPIMVLAISGLYGFKASVTVQTAAWDSWSDENWVLGTIVVSLVVSAPPVLMNFVRGAPYNPRALHSKWLRRALSLIVFPPLGYFAFVVASYDALPAAWNLVTEPERGTIQYEVVQVSDARRTRDCTNLQLVDAPDRRMYVCNVSGQMVRNLRPGDVIEVTGPLSEYGHTFETVRIVE